jgi:hypothetical protein
LLVWLQAFITALHAILILFSIKNFYRQTYAIALAENSIGQKTKNKFKLEFWLMPNGDLFNMFDKIFLFPKKLS